MAGRQEQGSASDCNTLLDGLRLYAKQSACHWLSDLCLDVHAQNGLTQTKYLSESCHLLAFWSLLSVLPTEKLLSTCNIIPASAVMMHSKFQRFGD